MVLNVCMCVCACVYGKTLYITTSAGVPQLFYTRYILIPIPRHIHVHTYIHMHMCCSIQFVRWPVFISFWFLVFSLVFLISVSHTRCVILLLCSVFAMCCAVLFSCWAVLFAPIFFTNDTNTLVYSRRVLCEVDVAALLRHCY